LAGALALCFWYLVVKRGLLSSDMLSLYDSSLPLYSDSDCFENKLTESNELSFLLKESSRDEEPAAVDIPSTLWSGLFIKSLLCYLFLAKVLGGRSIGPSEDHIRWNMSGKGDKNWRKPPAPFLPELPAKLSNLGLFLALYSPKVTVFCFLMGNLFLLFRSYNIYFLLDVLLTD